MPSSRPRTNVVCLVALSLLVLLSCAGDPAPSQTPVDGREGCAAGELALPDGRCQPAGLPLDLPCPPGEAALSTGGCRPAGVPAERCAAGFKADDRGGCAAILPEAPCPLGTMAVPGDTACREVARCGDGPWGDIPVDATTEHVDKSYPASDSDGSRAKPWKTISAGLRAAAPGAIVAVAEGVYQEDLLVASRPVRLWGRCPARTQVTGLGGQSAAILISGERASGSEVRDLAVAGPARGISVRGARSILLAGVWVHETGLAGMLTSNLAEVTVRGSLIEQCHNAGICNLGSETTIDSSVVRATGPVGAALDGIGIITGFARDTGERGRMRLVASLVEQSALTGVFASGSDAIVEGTVVRTTQPVSGRIGGRGVSVDVDPTGARSTLRVSSSLIEQNREAGVYVSGSDATIEATVVRDTRAEPAQQLGVGVVLQHGGVSGANATLSLSASLIEGNRGVGVMLTAAEAKIDSTVVRGTQLSGGYPEFDGPGIVLQPGTAIGERTKVSLSASVIEQNHGFGVRVEGSDANVETTVVRATQPNSAGEFGLGISVRDGSTADGRGTLSLSASVIEQNHHAGVMVQGSEASIVSTIVRDTQPGDGGVAGEGILVARSAEADLRGTLSLSASLLERNREVGVYVAGSDATIDATVVRDTQPNGAGFFGQGVNIAPHPMTYERGVLSLSTSLLEGNHQVGVFVGGSDATIAATVVRGTQRTTSGSDDGDGIVAMGVPQESRVTITDSESTDNARVGMYYLDSTGQLSTFRSSRNRFGLVLEPGAHGAQPVLGADNVFEDNTETDIVMGGDIPVPDAIVPLP